MIRRTVIFTAAAALVGGAAYLAPAGHAVGNCNEVAPTPAGTVVPFPDGGSGGKVWANGDAATQSGNAGITGTHGFLYASGSAASGGTIQGYNPETGLNGTVNISRSGAPTIAVGSNQVACTKA